MINEFLKEYINTPSPSGYEVLLGGQKVWIDYVSQFCEKVEIDEYGNPYPHYNKKIDGQKTIVLDMPIVMKLGFLFLILQKKDLLK